MECESTFISKANDLAKKINIFEGLHLTNEARNNIINVTIRNWFLHGGFVKIEKKENDRSIEMQEDLTDKTYEDWMNIDRDLQTSEEYSEDQICQSITNEAIRKSR